MCDGQMPQFDCDNYAEQSSIPCDPIPGGNTTVSISGGQRVSATADASGRFTLSIDDVGDNPSSYVEFSAENHQGLRHGRISTDACFSAGDHFFLVRLPARECAKRKP